MKSWLLNAFNIIAGCASIMGIFFLFFTNEEIGKIALASFSLFLLLLLVTTWIGIVKVIKKEYPEDYKKIAAFTSYETGDGIHGVYEVFKVIQSKRIVLQQIEHNFKWTGSKRPEISSALQDIKQIIESNGNNYDKAVLSLRKPLRFHVKAITDDFDHKAQPHLDYKVNNEINIILFRVTLKSKAEDFHTPARLLKKSIDSSIPVEYQQFGSVPFDAMSKSYQYYLINPEIGYYYRLEWEK